MAHLITKQGMSWSGRERNRMFLSVGGQQFMDVSAVTGTDFIEDGRALGLLDWDHDGQVDMLLRNRTAPRLRLLRNSSGDNRHFLQIPLHTQTAGVNRDAIGARVRVTAGGRLLSRSVYAGDGFLSQSSKTLFFGLDDATLVDKLTILWPNGEHQEFLNLPADSFLEVTQGSSELQTVGAAGRPTTWNHPAQSQERLDTADLGRVTVISKLPLAEFPLPSFDNPERKVKDFVGRPLLINFWSTGCAACIEELGTLDRNRKKLSRAGLQIVTLLTDGPDKFSQAKKILAALNMQSDAGIATEQVTACMRIVAEAVLTADVDMPLPVSLLLDQDGQLVQIHLGAVRVPALLQDLAILRRMDPHSPSASSLAYGSRIVFRDRDFEGIANLFLEAKMPELAAYYTSFLNRFQPKSDK
jgi:thiol-disulfide isomerase/thioredoxin